MIDSIKLSKERNLYFIGEVGQESVCNIIKAINEQDSELKSAISQFTSLFPGCTIEVPNLSVYINSEGGEVISALGYYDFIRNFEKDLSRVTSIANGLVASAAVIMYLSSNYRVAYPNSYFIIHPVTGFSFDFIDRMTDDLKFTNELQDRITDIIESRTNITRGKLESVVKGNKDWVINASEALDLGICHEILYN